MSVKIVGLEDVVERFEKIADAAKVREGIKNSCLLVERQAKINAQALGSGETGLAGSITSDIKDYEGVVYTPLFYAPYVEYGTGIEAEGGKGRQDVPWVYVEHSGQESGNAQKSYTYETAMRAVAILKDKGLDAHLTYGQKPQPFMRPALDVNRDKILDLLGEGLIKDD